MKIIVTESQLKKIIVEQDSWTSKAASGPQKCGRDAQWCSDGSSKDDRQWDKELKRQEKIDARQSAQELQDYLNPRIDRLGGKVDKKDFNERYLNFVKVNPDFESQSSALTPVQRFGILYKESGSLRNPEYYLTSKFNKMFNHSGSIDMQTFYNMIKQMGGFDKYFEEYKKGFPIK